MATYAQKILHLEPAAQFSIVGDDYSTLIWNGPGAKPLEAAIVAVNDVDAEDTAKEVAASDIHNKKALKAIIFGTADRLGVARNTFAAEVKAIYKGLL